MTLQTHPADSDAERCGEPMVLGHYLTYQRARSNLCALAETAIPGRLHDYWDVLEVIDALHRPLQLTPTRPVVGASRYAMYAAAAQAITHLSRYGLDPVRLLEARDLLAATWSTEPHDQHVSARS